MQGSQGAAHLSAENHQCTHDKSQRSSDVGLTASDAKSSAELQRAYRQRQREQAELDARLARHKFEVDRYSPTSVAPMH
jgi:hypothetical protein